MMENTWPWATSGVRLTHLDTRLRFLQVLNASGNAVAYVPYSDITAEDHRESHADQRLLAAAPELYEALKDVMALINSGLLVRSTVDDTKPGWAIKQLPIITGLAKAMTALGKATGGSL